MRDNERPIFHGNYSLEFTCKMPKICSFDRSFCHKKKINFVAQETKFLSEDFALFIENLYSKKSCTFMGHDFVEPCLYVTYKQNFKKIKERKRLRPMCEIQCIIE